MADQFKVALRNTIKQIRARLSVAYRIQASNQICNRIKSLDQYRKAKRIALYCAANGEVDLHSLWDSAPLHGKFCYFPAIKEDLTLSFLPATPATPFKTNKYGIQEPDVPQESALPVEQLDLILIPLVAFDTQCNRLGMGAGFYDRTLKNNTKGCLMGVAYQFQHQDYLYSNPWDIPLNAVVTQKRIYIATK
ncbi:MAG TPA: 5-formyltetrahydrofolate cyclo-ligase [Legionella sp.]|nr:5-formyltetrahydrofolate cyclo-ligase [Legionella sp.]